MTKNELLKNLKEYDRLGKNSENWFITLLFMACVCFLLANYFFDFQTEISDWIGWAVAATIIILMVYDIRLSKKIDKQTSMYCNNCHKRFDENTLAYAVLKNECQNCKHPIYDGE